MRLIIDADSGEQAVLTLNRQKRGLDEDDRRGLLAPGPWQGFVLLEGAWIAYASAAARTLLTQWFGEHDSRLPAPVEDWRRRGRPPEPLLVERAGRRLTIEAPTPRALLVSEAAAPPDGLTPRELEVLECLAAGHSTAEIARLLWVRPATVSKHLEHVYRKLGVHSRTAALAAAGLGRLLRSG